MPPRQKKAYEKGQGLPRSNARARDRRLTAAAKRHLHASHDRTLSPETPPEAAAPPLPK